MPRFVPVSRRELIRRLVVLGFDGPYAGGWYEFLLRGDMRLILPNPHRGGNQCGLVNASIAPGQDHAGSVGLGCEVEVIYSPTPASPATPAPRNWKPCCAAR